MRTFDDIVPPSRRTNPPPPPPPPGVPSGAPRRPRGRFPFITIIIALLVIGGSAAALVYYSGAKVEVIPVATSIAVESSYTVDPATGELPFEIISAKKTGSEEVEATGTKQVTESASGEITIYNTQSVPQKLVATTRFATPAGLVYKIPKAVTVPAGTNAKPGTITTSVVASEAGPTYNIGPSSFTLPGLAGTPQESAVYGRSAGSIQGGASGTVPVVDPAAEQAALSKMQDTLAADLAGDLSGQVPEGYVLLPGATATSYRTLTPSTNEGGKATIQAEGTITGVVFPLAALARVIAANSGSVESTGTDVELGEGSTLTLAATGAFPASNTESFSFTLSGTANLVARVDPLEIATAVAGKSRSEAEVALTNYPEVKRAILVLRPFWRQSFPEDPTGTAVVVLPPEGQ